MNSNLFIVVPYDDLDIISSRLTISKLLSGKYARNYLDMGSDSGNVALILFESSRSHLITEPCRSGVAGSFWRPNTTEDTFTLSDVWYAGKRDRQTDRYEGILREGD